MTKMLKAKAKFFPCPCPSPAVKYLSIVILVMMIQYLDIAAGKHWQTTRHYKFNVTISTANQIIYTISMEMFDYYINLWVINVLRCVAGEAKKCDTSLPHKIFDYSEWKVSRAYNYCSRGRPSPYKTCKPHQRQHHYSLVILVLIIFTGNSK